jgi:hypothetical protein|tara:strand:+ start:155 stop:364 length:210 start_codon:yes stop_codon:yes gene_type:complete
MVLVEPLSDKAKQWIDEKVEQYPLPIGWVQYNWLGPNLAIPEHYAVDILERFHGMGWVQGSDYRVYFNR